MMQKLSKRRFLQFVSIVVVAVAVAACARRPRPAPAPGRCSNPRPHQPLHSPRPLRRCEARSGQGGGGRRAADEGRAALAARPGGLPEGGLRAVVQPGRQRQGKGERRSVDQPGRQGDHHHPAGRARLPRPRPKQPESRGRQGHLLRPPDPRHRCGGLLCDLRQHGGGRGLERVPDSSRPAAPRATRCICMPARPPTTTPSSSSKAPGRRSSPRSPTAPS